METFTRILEAAIAGGASDVHVKVGHPVICRINRQLVPMQAPIPTNAWMESIVKKIVPPHALRRFEDEREVDFSYFGEGIGRFRTNLFQQKGSWCLAMRYVKTQIWTLDELGLLPDVVLTLRKIAESHRGIVLIAGTTGSGKSTTLAAMIQHVNAHFCKHIITLEDPIEYVFDDNKSVLEQREIGLDTLSFGHGLRNILRQDPDIIMVGEMRDAVSFQAAISAADTGHLVFSTLHTTNASQSVSRILDFFKADDREQIRRQLVGTLQAVVCQRMVPTLDGGVTPAMEMLVNTGTVKKLIEENRLDKLAAAIETGTDDGMQTFNQALFNLVKARKISEKDALAKATNAQALEMNFKGIFLDEGRRILG